MLYRYATQATVIYQKGTVIYLSGCSATGLKLTSRCLGGYVYCASDDDDDDDASGRGACMSVDLYVCVFVCMRGYLKNHTPKLNKIFCECYLWLWLSTTVAALQYVLYFCYY